MIISAGLLMYRQKETMPEVFLAHPGGPYYKKKDAGVWSIPKGLREGEEDLLVAARREFFEETGMVAHGPFIELGTVKLTSGKVIYAWAFEGKREPPETIVSNVFTIEWPPKSGRMSEFPEVDRAAYVSIDAAYELIYPSQRPFLERLRAALAEQN